MHANSAWSRLCGWSQEEMVGRDLRCLQGPATNRQAIKLLMEAVNGEKHVTIPELVNYDKQRRPFKHTLTITPLVTRDGNVECFRATSIGVSRLCSHCDDATASVDLREQYSLLEGSRGDEPVDSTAAALAAVATQKRELLAAGSGSFDLTRDEWLATRHLGCGGAAAGLLGSQCLLRQPSVPSYVVLTEARPPYAILWASRGWLDLCHFRLDEIMGKDLKCIQGPATSKSAIQQMMEAVRQQKTVTLPLINYDKRRRPFKHLVTVEPLLDDASADAAMGDAEHDDDQPPPRALLAPQMFRAVSTEVARSCNGVFSLPPCPAVAAAVAASRAECSLDVWSSDALDPCLRKKPRTSIDGSSVPSSAHSSLDSRVSDEDWLPLDLTDFGVA